MNFEKENKPNTLQRLQTHCGPRAEQICSLTGLNATDLANFIYEFGLVYTLNWPSEKLQSSRYYWNWYKTVWYANDDLFIAENATTNLPADKCVSLYRQYKRQMNEWARIPSETLRLISNGQRTANQA